LEEIRHFIVQLPQMEPRNALHLAHRVVHKATRRRMRLTSDGRRSTLTTLAETVDVPWLVLSFMALYTMDGQ